MSGGYRDLKVWQRSIELSLDVYHGTQKFPSQDVYGLTHPLRRAAVWIASNLAEGKGRSGDRDFAFFLCHARGSVHELETQTLIGRQLGDLSGEAADTIEGLTSEIGRMLNRRFYAGK